MKNRFSLTVAVSALAMALAGAVSAATLYVALDSPNPVAPFATWDTAATNIQDAVDAAKAGDTVLVTNGVYAVGERDGNRVVITNAIRLESVNGLLLTTIEGNQLLDEWGQPTNGIRCVLLGTNAALSGFTLTNGGANSGGGVWCASTNVIITNCVVARNSASGVGGGAYGGTLYNCTLTGNSAGNGGGAYESTMNNCILAGNSATGPYNVGSATGGGAYGGTLSNCTLTGNTAYRGGGAYAGTLYNCTVTSNSAGGLCSCKDDYAPAGGGAFGSTLYNCALTDNGGATAAGAFVSTLYNCVLTGNSADDLCGGAGGSTLYNCTLTGNSAQNGGAGACSFWSRCVLYNCIIYDNPGGNYDEGTTLNYCCTIPLPTNGIGNITGPPLFMDMAAGDFRLREGSPCIDAGTNLLGFTMTITNADTGDISVISYTHDPTDILGNTRFIDGNGDGKVAWDIGAYEFNSFKPPRFNVQPQFTADGWKLNITGAPNQWTRLQRSSDLKNWEDIWSGFMRAEGAQQVNDGDMGQKVMFYRALVP